jgi:lipopolysaccharide transport protein LptA
LNNSAKEELLGLNYSQRSWRLTAFRAVVLLVLWAGADCKPTWAQHLSESTKSAQTSSVAQRPLQTAKKTEKADTKSAGRRSTPQSVPSDSKTQDSQTPFGALTNNNRGPISIQSDSLALDYKQNAVLFSGHVHASQADGALISNTLHVKYGKNFHEVQDMAADGNVHISQGVRWCTSDHAEMHQSQHIVILTGGPICHDERDQIAGTKITVHLDTGKSDVEAAKAVIFPQQAKTRDNETLAAQAK